jgi:hypothetical protein
MRRLLHFLLLLGTLGFGCANDPAGVSVGERNENGLNVLFIGNSLTYWNDLPAIIAALADSAKVKPLSWVQVAFPDFALEDHWAEGSAVRSCAAENGTSSYCSKDRHRSRKTVRT